MALKETLLCFLFPRRCRYCGEVIDLRRELCDTCRPDDCRVTGDVCPRCGCEKAACNCRPGKPFYEQVAAPFYYEGAAEKALHRLKFGKRPEAADVLAEEMARCLQERYEGYTFDVCTYVPLTKKGLKQRGFNQSELLAKTVAEQAGIPLKALLQKDYETPMQHRLRSLERSGNLLGAFSVPEGETAALQNARVLLVDDIKTSGATLNECAKTLLIAGAAEVFCLTAAVTRLRRGRNAPENPDRE